MVVAIVLMALMLGLGIAALGLTDTESHRSGEQRERESALQLDEGVLYAQSLVLSTKWPNAANPYPSSCTSAGAASDQCPSAANLAGAAGTNFSNVDQLNNSAWMTKVRDNGGALANAYDPLQADAAQTTRGRHVPADPVHLRLQQDNEVWVQAQSTVRGKPRNVVARLRLEELTENVPQAAVTAGAISITNNGDHGGTPLIDGTGSAVVVRCTTSDAAEVRRRQERPDHAGPSDGLAAQPDDGGAARSLQAARDHRRQLLPGLPDQGRGGNLSRRRRLDRGLLSSTPEPRQPGCDRAVRAAGGHVRHCVRQRRDQPGLMIWHCGRGDIQGGWTHRGIIYMVNNSDGTCAPSLPARGDGTCVGNGATTARRAHTNGGFGIWGALAVDGLACIKVGSNGLQIIFDANVFDVGLVLRHGRPGAEHLARAITRRTPKGASGEPADRNHVLKTESQEQRKQLRRRARSRPQLTSRPPRSPSTARSRSRAAPSPSSVPASCATVRSPTRRRSRRR